MGMAAMLPHNYGAASEPSGTSTHLKLTENILFFAIRLIVYCRIKRKDNHILTLPTNVSDLEARHNHTFLSDLLCSEYVGLNRHGRRNV